LWRRWLLLEGTMSSRRPRTLMRYDVVGETSLESLNVSLPAGLLGAVADAVAEVIASRLEDKFEDRRSPWMTTVEAIDYTRLPEGTFRKLAASGAIPSHGGRSKLFHRAEVDEALGYVAPAQPALRRIAG